MAVSKRNLKELLDSVVNEARNDYLLAVRRQNTFLTKKQKKNNNSRWKLHSGDAKMKQVKQF